MPQGALSDMDMPSPILVALCGLGSSATGDLHWDSSPRDHEGFILTLPVPRAHPQRREGKWVCTSWPAACATSPQALEQSAAAGGFGYVAEGDLPGSEAIITFQVDLQLRVQAWALLKARIEERMREQLEATYCVRGRPPLAPVEDKQGSA